MKNFILNILACIIAITITSIFGVLMVFVMFVASIASSASTPSFTDNSILKIDLNGPITDKSDTNFLDVFLGKEEDGSNHLATLKTAIAEAATNKKVKGIYLNCGAVSSDFATLEELREALIKFKESNKFIIAYGDMMTQGTYYIASVADKVYLNPSGMLSWTGLSSNPIFYKKLLEKVGVEMQIFRVGTFKSAVEPYMLDKMSDANRMMTSSMLNSLWNNICKDVSASRKIPVEQLKNYANSYQELTEPTNYVKEKLVDKLLYVDEVRDVLRRYLGDQTISFVSPAVVAQEYKAPKSKEKVIIYVAEGEIVDNRIPTSPWNNNNNVIAGNEVIDDLDKLANDDNVKSVVLRINSPGGSAYASEQIWRAVQLLKKKKPVVVSMGGLAASGGYYMSCSANYIFANPMTLTGSIGIFGMIPNTAKLQEEKLGLSYDHVSTNSIPAMAAPTGKMSPQGAAAMQAYVERGYQLFLRRVADGRKLKVSQVDSIAQGRVWTGEQAIRIGLVDQLGNLSAAVKKAAQLAKLKDYEINYYDNNNPLQWLEDAKSNYFEREIKNYMGEYYKPVSLLQNIMHRSPLQARMTFDPNIQ